MIFLRCIVNEWGIVSEEGRKKRKKEYFYTVVPLNFTLFLICRAVLYNVDDCIFSGNNYRFNCAQTVAWWLEPWTCTLGTEHQTRDLHLK